MKEQWEINWQDYYEILGIDSTANIEEIKKTFRDLLKKYHPDHNPDQTEEEREIFLEISAAYEVLSDPKKKKKYDKAWNAYQSGDSSFVDEEEQDINYEDISKEYTEEEIEYAKKIALQKLVQEELKTVNDIIDAKNDIIFSVYIEDFEKKEYYEKVKEFGNIVLSISNRFKELSIEAYKMDLMIEVDNLDKALNYVINEVNNMPTSPNDAKKYVRKEILAERIKGLIERELDTNNILIESFEKIILDIYQKNIVKLNYSDAILPYIWNANSNISELNHLNKIAKVIKLNNGSINIEEAATKLSGLLLYISDDYEDMIEIANKLNVKRKMESNIEDFALVEKKINKLLTLFGNYPYSDRCVDLYNYGLEIIDNLSNSILKLDPYAKSFFNKEISIKTNLVDLMGKAKELYVDSKSSSKKAESILKKTETVNINLDSKTEDIKILAQGTLASSEKWKALDCYVDAKVILDSFGTATIDSKEYDSIYKELREVVSKLSDLKKVYEDKYKHLSDTFYIGYKGIDYIKKLIGLNAKIYKGVAIIGVEAFAVGMATKTLLVSGSEENKEVAAILTAVIGAAGMMLAFKYAKGLVIVNKEKQKVKKAYKSYRRANAKRKKRGYAYKNKPNKYATC